MFAGLQRRFFAILLLSGVYGMPADTAYADDCLTAPTSSASGESQWLNGVYLGNVFKCWYLRALGQPEQKIVAQDSPTAAPARRSQLVAGRLHQRPRLHHRRRKFQSLEMTVHVPRRVLPLRPLRHIPRYSRALHSSKAPRRMLIHHQFNRQWFEILTCRKLTNRRLERGPPFASCGPSRYP